jgi:hypothetical protein
VSYYVRDLSEIDCYQGVIPDYEKLSLTYFIIQEMNGLGVISEKFLQNSLFLYKAIHQNFSTQYCFLLASLPHPQ